MRHAPLSLLSLLMFGCIADLLAQGDALIPEGTWSDSTTTGDSTSTGETPTTTTGDPGVQTVTGDEDPTAAATAQPQTDTGSPADAPPTITLFDGIPDHIGEAGPVLLQLLASADVTSVQLSLDDVSLADDLTPADFPFTHEFLSAADNGPDRSFKVVVADEGGLTAQAEAHVAVLLPASGADKCSFVDPEHGAVSSGVSALEYTRTAIVAVGARDTGVGPRLTVWKLDPNTCQALAGWPRTLADWTADAALAGLTSVGAAIDVDDKDNLVVAGNFLVAGSPRSYVALLNAGGSLLWEHAGPPGDEVAGVAVATGQFSDRTLVVGSRRTSDDPVRTDGAIWSYQTVGNKASVGPPTLLKAPFTDQEFEKDGENKRSEWIRAIVIHPGTGNGLAVGEREFSPDGNVSYVRALAVRIHPLGQVVGAPWTSPADTWFVHDAARSIAVCGDEFIAGGWTRDVPMDAPLQPMLFWLDANGISTQQRPEVALAPSQTHGVACDREHKIISAGTRTAGPLDAQVFMVKGPQGPRTVYEPGMPGNDSANAVACDARGFCGWGGFRSENNKPYAVVRVHHP